MSGNRGNRAWPRAAGTVATHDEWPAASGLYPFFSRSSRVFFLAMTLPQQKAIRQHHQRRVVVESTPRPSLKVVQAQLLFHLLIALFHRPATLPEPHRPLDPRLFGQVAEGVFDLAIGLLLDQQPQRPLAGALPPLPARCRPDTQPGKPPDSFPLLPSRQLTRRNRTVWASSSRVIGWALPWARRGRERGRPLAPA